MNAIAAKVPAHERNAWWAPCRFQALPRDRKLLVSGTAYALEAFERRGYAGDIRRLTGFAIEYLPS